MHSGEPKADQIFAQNLALIRLGGRRDEIVGVFFISLPAPSRESPIPLPANGFEPQKRL